MGGRDFVLGKGSQAPQLLWALKGPDPSSGFAMDLRDKRRHITYPIFEVGSHAHTPSGFMCLPSLRGYLTSIVKQFEQVQDGPSDKLKGAGATRTTTMLHAPSKWKHRT